MRLCEKKKRRSPDFFFLFHFAKGGGEICQSGQFYPARGHSLVASPLGQGGTYTWEVGQGTTLKVYLPRMLGPRDEIPIVASPSDIPRGEEREASWWWTTNPP